MTKARLEADLAAAEREFDRLDAQADTSASVKTAVLSIRLQCLRVELAACEEEKNGRIGLAEIDARR